MKKKVKIREIKKDLKVFEKSHSESEGDKEISELTKGEVPVHDAEFTQPGAVIFRPDAGDNSPRISSRVNESVNGPRTESPRTESSETRQLYDVGKGMGDHSSRGAYKPVESIGSSGIRNMQVGRDFAMGSSGGGDYPEANRIESNLRQDDEKKYASSVESGSGKRGKRYAWET